MSFSHTVYNHRLLVDPAVAKDSLVDAVKVLQLHEMAARKNIRSLSAQETAIVQHMCQVRVF